MKIINEKIKNAVRNEIRGMGGIQGRKRTYSISARIGKHYCPYCGNLLQIKTITRIINSESEEAKDYDFSSIFEGGSLFGNVEFTWEVYYCISCRVDISIKDMKKYERELKKRGSADFDAVQGVNKKKIKWPNFLVIGFIITMCILLYFILTQFI